MILTPNIGFKNVRGKKLQGQEPPAPSIDPDYQAVLDYADANSITKPSNINSLNSFVIGLKDAGLYTKLDVINVFAHNDLAMDSFSTICLKRKNQCIPTNLTYTVEGYEGNGSDGFIDQIINLRTETSNFTLNSASRVNVIYKEATSTSKNIDGQKTQFYNLMSNNSSINQRVNSSSNNAAIDLSGTGLKALSRLDSTNLNGYNKDIKTSVTGTSTNINTISTDDYVLFRGGTNYSNTGISFNFIGSSLTDTEVADLRTICNNYLTTIGLTAHA